MKKFLPIVIFAFSVFGLRAQSFNPLLANMLQDTLNAYASQISNIKGMSASVHIPGQGTWTGVYGNSFAGNPITENMRFGIASNSKLFVSVMMLKLVENNIISLDDSLDDWLTITNSNINPNITIRQLLNHSSGISDPFFVSPWFEIINANPTRVFTPNEVLGWVGAPLFSAGTSWSYSNTNYVLAAMIAESATGTSLSTLIRDSLLTPISLNNTFIDVEESVNGVIAHRWWNTIDYNDTSRVGLNTAVGYAGSIFSTSSDMVKWYDAVFSGQVINESSMNELTIFVTTPNPNYQYGLGLSRETTQGLQYFGHGGRTWGYKSKMLYDTCLDVSVAGLSNADPSGMDAVTFLIYRAVKNHIPGCGGAISGLNTVCEGTNFVTYTVPPIPNAKTYLWTLPSGVTGTSNTNSISVNFGIGASSGEIKVTGVNNYGPGGSSSIWVTVNPIPETPVITLSGDVLSSNAPFGNQWYNSSGIIANAINPYFINTVDDDYYCIVTLLGCNSEPSNIINTVTTGILETSFQNDFKIYPNPTSSQATILTDVWLNNATLVVTNSYGQIVTQVKKINGKTNTFNRDYLDSGLYFIQLFQDNQLIATKKLLITN